MILTTCKYFDLVGNRCSRVTDGKCNDLQDCEFKYIAELKAENEKLIEDLGIANKYVNKYHQTLQEIKKIANYWQRKLLYDTDERMVFDVIIDLITKAEEE